MRVREQVAAPFARTMRRAGTTNGERQPDDALRAECGQAAEHGKQRQRHQHQTGPQPEPMGDRDSGGKEPGRMEERDSAQDGCGTAIGGAAPGMG